MRGGQAKDSNPRRQNKKHKDLFRVRVLLTCEHRYEHGAPFLFKPRKSSDMQIVCGRPASVSVQNKTFIIKVCTEEHGTLRTIFFLCTAQMSSSHTQR